MSLLPPALVLLTYLRLRAWGRSALRLLRTPRGILMAIGGTFLLAMWLLPALLMDRHSVQSPFAIWRTRAVDLGPYVILVMILASLIRSPGEQALAFLQAEVDFLFPAPFTRRQLLFYKLAQRIVPFAGMSALMALWTRSMTSSFIAAAVGAFLIFWLMHLTSLCVAMAGQSVDAGRFRRWRLLVLAAIAGLIVGGALWAGRDLAGDSILEKFESFRATTLGSLLALPTYPFVRAFTATSLWPDLFVWGGVALAINLALVLLAMTMNSDWLEAGAENSAKLAERVEEVRRSGGMGGAGATFRSLALPDFPRLGGVGPFAWRQALTGIRLGPRSFVIVAVIAAIVIIPSLFSSNTRTSFRPTAIFLVAYMSLFLPQMLRLDFRGDIDRFDLLKSLPTPPLILCIGQVVTPAALITVLQVALATLVLVLNDLSAFTYLIWLVPLFAANLVLMSVDNAFFLYLPSRPTQGAGMHISGAQMMVQVARLMALALLFGSAAGVAALGAFASGGSLVVAALVATVVLLVEAVVMIQVMSGLFARFDPTKHAAPE